MPTEKPFRWEIILPDSWFILGVERMPSPVPVYDMSKGRVHRPNPAPISVDRYLERALGLDAYCDLSQLGREIENEIVHDILFGKREGWPEEWPGGYYAWVQRQEQPGRCPPRPRWRFHE
jgi:hypothetical protein